MPFLRVPVVIIASYCLQNQHFVLIIWATFLPKLNAAEPSYPDFIICSLHIINNHSLTWDLRVAAAETPKQHSIFTIGLSV